MALLCEICFFNIVDNLDSWALPIQVQVLMFSSIITKYFPLFSKSDTWIILNMENWKRKTDGNIFSFFWYQQYFGKRVVQNELLEPLQQKNNMKFKGIIGSETKKWGKKNKLNRNFLWFSWELVTHPYPYPSWLKEPSFVNFLQIYTHSHGI